MPLSTASTSSTTTKGNGLRCPNCGCPDLFTVDGRPWIVVKTERIPGAIRRYRICRYCGRRIRTREHIERSIPGRKGGE